MSPDSIEIPTLLTERLLLRPFRRSDVDDYAAMYADPEVVRHVAAVPAETWDRGRSWRHMAFVVGHWQLKGTGPWAVELKGDGTFVGAVGFYEPDGWPGFELAGYLARRWWGHGYATEAARAALDHAFTIWKRDRVISLVNPENRRSIRVVERLGERLEGRTDLFGREMLLYGLNRETWLSRPRQESLLAS